MLPTSPIFSTFCKPNPYSLPPSGAGTTKAAVDAATLASCLQAHNFDLPKALEAFDESQLDLARYLVGVGVRIGTASQFPGQRP